jgi:hypothetical protein
VTALQLEVAHPAGAAVDGFEVRYLVGVGDERQVSLAKAWAVPSGSTRARHATRPGSTELALGRHGGAQCHRNRSLDLDKIGAAVPIYLASACNTDAPLATFS